MRIRLLGKLLLVLALILATTDQSFAASELNFTQSTGLPAYQNNNWINEGGLPAYASNEDGSKVLATLGALFISNDYGTTWTPVNIPNSADVSTNPFTAVWISKDGLRMAVAQYRGDIFLTSDAGVTWHGLGQAFSSTSIALSDDLNNIYVSTGEHWSGSNWVDNGSIWISRNSGSTWNVGEISGDRVYESVNSSVDGHLVTVIGGNRLYQSVDFGATWTFNSNSGDLWGSCCWHMNSSDDGQVILVGSNGQGFYLSTDGGISFRNLTEIPPNWHDSPNTWGYGVGVSRNGMYLAAVDVGDYVYISQDSGATWTQQTNLGKDTWAGGVSISNNGDVVVGTDKGIDWWAIHTGNTYFYKSTQRQQPISHDIQTQPSLYEVRQAQEASRQREILRISNLLKERISLSKNQFTILGVSGVSDDLLSQVNSEIQKLPKNQSIDVELLKSIVYTQSVLIKIISNTPVYYPNLVKAGLIPNSTNPKIRAAIVRALRSIPAGNLNTIERVQSIIENLKIKYKLD